jgi:hypothetical protein
MADITIHGIDEKVVGQLQQDADAQGVSLEDLILHILSDWNGMKQAGEEYVQASTEYTQRLQEEVEALRKRNTELENTPIYIPVEEVEPMPIHPFVPTTLDWAALEAGEHGEPDPPYPAPREIPAWDDCDGVQKKDETEEPK